MTDIDKSESHLHWHALVHFTSGKLASWKQKAWRHKIKFASKKNTFKRIICLDHAVGVLRYVACSDGQHSLRRGPDGKVTHPHSHYQRQPISDHHRHKRGKDCSVIRKWISAKIACHLDLKDKPNWNAWELHDVQSCKCDRGSIGKKKREDANEKRKAFYKTEKGIAIKQMYKDRIAMKKKLLKQLSTMNGGSGGGGSRESKPPYFHYCHTLLILLFIWSMFVNGSLLPLCTSTFKASQK